LHAVPIYGFNNDMPIGTTSGVCFRKTHEIIADIYQTNRLRSKSPIKV